MSYNSFIYQQASSKDPNKCIVSGFGGSAHPYGYCVKPISQMIDYGALFSASNMNMKALEAYAGGFINYVTSLVSNPTNSLANECLNKLGNKYLLKTESKCSNGSSLHKYINNMDYFNIITGRTSTGNDGIIPAAVSSATKINALGMFNAIVGPSVPECVKVKVPCHLVDRTNVFNSYFGESPEVYISKDEYDSLVWQGVQLTLINEPETNKSSDTDANETTESFSNIDKNLLNNDMISNIYILSITLILIYLTYKLMHKK